MDKSEILLRKWINEVIVGLKLCPFAKESLPKLEIKKSFFNDSDRLLDEIIKYSDQILKGEVSNAIIYFDEQCNFEDLNDACNDFQEILDQMGLKIKLVAFHPDFIFDKTSFENRANFVNRSPLPLIHLISILEIQNLNLTSKEAENISLLNEKKLNELNSKELKEKFSYLDKL